MVRTLVRNKVDLVGLQEVQPNQRYALTRAAGSAWTQYPRASSGGDNRLLWRTAAFRLVTSKPMSIPYFNGHHAQVPAALLQHRRTGHKMWVVSIHNPAETGTYHHQGGHRAAALRVERAAVQRLSRWGYPVLLTGDFNDRGNAFCAMTTGRLMTSAYGSRPGSACHVPSRSQIDWIFGIGVQFSHYRTDFTPTHQHVSDHPLIRTVVHLSNHGTNSTNACAQPASRSDEP